MTSAVILTVSDLELLEAFYPNLKYFEECDLHVVCYNKSETALDFSSREIIKRCKSFGFSPVVDIVTCEMRSDAVNTVLQGIDLSAVDYVFVLDETLNIGASFMEEMRRCFSPAKVSSFDGDHFVGYQDVGIVGACLSGNHWSKGQQVDLTSQDISHGLEGYCEQRLSHFSGHASMSAWIDGSFLCMQSRHVEKLMSDNLFLDSSLGDFVWQDLCLRLSKLGLSCLVSEASFALVSGPDVSKPALVDKLKLFAKHQVKTNTSSSVMYRACIRSWQDLQIFRASIIKCSKVFDSMVVVLLNSPSDIEFDFEFARAQAQLSRQDKEMLEKCKGADKRVVEKAFRKWINFHVSQYRKDMLVSNMEIKVVIPEDSRYQSSQVNVGIELVERLGSDGIFIMDHDELIDDQLTRKEVSRLLKHPNPTIQAFDFQLVYHWDSPTLVRTEPPFGPTSEYKGSPTSVRFYRRNNAKFPRCRRMFNEVTTIPTPAVPEEAVSVSSMRVRLLSLTRSADRVRAGITSSEEHVSVSTYQPKTSLGLHMLAYESEDPADIERWMNTVYSLASSCVIVWTGEWADNDKKWVNDKRLVRNGGFETGPSRQLAAVCTIYGVDVIHCPLNDNISSSRNAGIDHLAKNKSLQWAMFIDPDEWFENETTDCRAVRAMLSSDRCGFLFRVANYRSNQEVPTISDSVRISRLDNALAMRMSGRVHESFDKSVQAIQSKGLHPRLAYAPFMLQHRGMSFETDAMDVKLTKYERLLRLELEDDPESAGAWVGLGWHYLNDGYPEMGYQCYSNAIDCAGQAYLPYKEMAYLKLREARDLLGQCEERLSPAHQFYKLCNSMNKWLVQYAPDHPVIDRGRDIELVDLPVYKVQ